MWKKMLQWYFGYVQVYLQGYAQERFLNLCRKRQITVWNVHVEEKKICCNMDLRDYFAVKGIAVKTKVFPRIVKRVGFPFLIQRIWCRKGMVFGFFSGVLLLYILSLFLWDISFSGQNQYTEEFLLKYLKSIQVTTGMPLRNIDCQEIESRIRRAYPDISWVSAELEGTKLSIALVETNLPESKKKEVGAYHMVAPVDGKVESIITRAGTPMVKAGDTVKEGDILISGIVEYKSDDGTIIEKKQVYADGDIWISGRITYKDTCQLVHKVKQFTGKEKKIREIWVLGKKFYLTNPFKGINKEKKYDIIANVCNVSVSKSFVLPISYGSRRYVEYEEVEDWYTITEAKNILQNRLQEFIKEKKTENIWIENPVVEFIETNQKVEIASSFPMKQKVDTLQEIGEEEWRLEQTDGIDGDHD